jgi:hypothetical protein
MCDDAGLTGSAWDLCQAYCAAQECDMDPAAKSCVMLRKNMKKQTGDQFFPCDTTIACLLCADPDPDNQQNTIGICEDLVEVDCPVVDDGSIIGVMAVDATCDEVTIPANGTPGCSEIPPQWGLIPNCQYTGPAFVCNFFIGGVLVDQCPAPPSCFE